MDDKVKKLIAAAGYLIENAGKPAGESHAWDALRDAISAIEHDGMIRTEDVEYVKDDAEVWRVYGSLHEATIGKCYASFKLVTTHAVDLRFAHYPNAIAKIDELMGQTPAEARRIEAERLAKGGGK